ncbi:Uu.00g122130.m01.CDS01 [Anthostomella pinea]|uniref:Uu.00g122130.m01.CDS01 n=1 Tax=Anthostomella pinea TaxID=933095 RepID=A0AAI8VH23_9PEZI|nr:Uu.00g122130.m01.CDS01 [Anthostomella pinea]
MSTKTHLPELEQGDDAKYPSQKGWPVTCPCLKSEPSYKLATVLPLLPNIIVAPPHLIQNWIDEFEKFHDGNRDSPASRMVITTTHSTFSTSSFVHRKKSAAFQCIVHEEKADFVLRAPDYNVVPVSKTSAGHVIVVSHAGCTALISLYEEDTVWKGNDGEATAVSQGWAVDLAGMKSEEDIAKFDEMDRDWRYLIEKFHNKSLDDKKRDAIQKREDDVTKILTPFIPQMINSWRKRSKFNGRYIFPEAPITSKACNMLDGPTRDAHRSLAREVQAWTDNGFEEAVRKWQNDEVQGDQPEALAFQRQELNLARLIRGEEVPYESMLVKKIQPWATETTRLIRENATSNKVREALAKSPWWKHKDELKRESPKLKVLRDYLDELIDLRKKNATDPALFSHLYVSLSEPPTENIEWYYVHAGLSQKERNELTDKFKEKKKYGNGQPEPMRVLISNEAMVGVRLNLQNANYCIVTEVLRNGDRQRQAFGRIDRQGQMMRPVLVQLYDKNNLAENVRRVRNDNRAKLANDPDEQVVEEIDLDDYV